MRQRNRDVVAAIQAYNRGRDEERLRLKYRAMRRDAFTFLRGSCHLFYQDWLSGTGLDEKSPCAWICGDLHFENFGSYKGDNRLTYFDINDFDEAALAPCSWDLVRFLSSVLVGAGTLELDHSKARDLGGWFLDAYAAALREGKPRWIERATAKGMVKDLLKSLKHRSHGEFIRSRTAWRHGRGRLVVDGRRALAASEDDRAKVIRALGQWAARQANPRSFEVLDVARRIAGTGSLGLERYVILVEGKGARGGCYLLDLKHQPGSVLQSFLKQEQPVWPTEADRVIAIQRRAQAIAPAFLSVLEIGGQSYVLRELMPTQDRLSLEHWHGKFRRLEKVMEAMGELVAWSHLRSGGRQGSAIADQWIEFGSRSDWQRPLLDDAVEYSRQVLDDWRRFAEAFDHGTIPR